MSSIWSTHVLLKVDTMSSRSILAQCGRELMILVSETCFAGTSKAPAVGNIFWTEYHIVKTSACPSRPVSNAVDEFWSTARRTRLASGRSTTGSGNRCRLSHQESAFRLSCSSRHLRPTGGVKSVRCSENFAYKWLKITVVVRTQWCRL